MENILTDIHTHTSFSYDGKNKMKDMLKVAESKKIKYYGISEHFDYDYLVNDITIEGEKTALIDCETYFKVGREYADYYKNKMNVLIGGEFGYTDNKEAWKLYDDVNKKYKPDFVVNSVHSDGYYDYYDKRSFYDNGKLIEKDIIYKKYLSLVKDSIDAPYDYDIIGHIGYSSRYAPYLDKTMEYEDYKSDYDEILTKIIKRNKILEVNTSNKGVKGFFLPYESVVRRYFFLGGKYVSFASDAHYIERIMDKRDIVVKILKEIGFKYITVPYKGKYILVDI